MGRAVGAAIGADGNLADFIDKKRLLILMDNFEQIVEAAPMVSSLLAETPNAKVLVTSREPLHLDSEQRYAVEPLPERSRGRSRFRRCYLPEASRTW